MPAAKKTASCSPDKTVQTMPAAKKTARFSADKTVQTIVAQLTKLSNELDELQNRPTEESLIVREKALNESVSALNDFRVKLDSMFQRTQHELDDLFSEHLWEKFHRSLPDYLD